jgi:hypothetical protein
LKQAEKGSVGAASGRVWASASGSFEKDRIGDDDVLASPQIVEESKVDLLKILKSANTIIPHVVLGSTILALVYPPSFTWFTTRSVLLVCFKLNLIQFLT